MGRPQKLPAPGVLDFDKKLIQLRKKAPLGVQPVPVVHQKDIQQAAVGETQAGVQTQ